MPAGKERHDHELPAPPDWRNCPVKAGSRADIVLAMTDTHRLRPVLEALDDFVESLALLVGGAPTAIRKEGE